MDGQSETTLQMLEDMLRECMIDFGGNYHKFLPLYDFSYYNSYHPNINMFSSMHYMGGDVDDT